MARIQMQIRLRMTLVQKKNDTSIVNPQGHRSDDIGGKPFGFSSPLQESLFSISNTSSNASFSISAMLVYPV